jgi:phosphate-selective porin O/P
MARSIFRERVVSVFATVLGTILLSGAGVPPARAQSAGGTTASGVSNALNPAISLNGLFLGTLSDPAADPDGFKIQEVELAMTSVVDPYFKANANVAFAPNRAGPGVDVSLEEAYALFTSLPAGWGLRAGRFLMPFGRHNQLHTHAFPFAEAPRSVQTILGPDSQSDVGLELSYAPLVPWYLNLRAYVGDGGTENVFDGDSKELAGGGRIENLWDLSDATTFEAAASYANGPDPAGGRKQLWGVDFRVKYRDPRQAQGRAWEGVVEILGAAPEFGPDQTGVYAFLRTRMKRRFWLGAGADFLSVVSDSTGQRETEHEAKGQIAFIPSEFSAVRVDLGWRDHPDAQRELFAQCQFNFTIGSHPAHTY